MIHSNCDGVRTLSLVLALMVGAGEAVAALGKVPSTLPAASASSVADSRILAAMPRVPSGLYTVQEVQLETGTMVQQYVTSAGLVFAISWRGPVLPDLSILLGDYFNEFKDRKSVV